MLLKSCSIKIKCKLENDSELEVGAEADLEVGEGLEEAHELLYAKVLKSVMNLTILDGDYIVEEDGEEADREQ